MSVYVAIILVIVLIAAIIGFVFNILALDKISKLTGYNTDGDLKSAHKDLMVSMIFGGVGITVVVLAVVLAIFRQTKHKDAKNENMSRDVTSVNDNGYTTTKGQPASSGGIHWIALLLLLGLFAIFTTSLIASGIAYSNINNSTNSGKKTTKDYIIYTMVAYIVSVIILLVAFILAIVMHDRISKKAHSQVNSNLNYQAENGELPVPPKEEGFTGF